MTIQNDKNVNARGVSDRSVDIPQQKLNHPEDNPNLKDADDNNGIGWCSKKYAGIRHSHN